MLNAKLQDFLNDDWKKSGKKGSECVTIKKMVNIIIEN